MKYPSTRTGMKRDIVLLLLLSVVSIGFAQEVKQKDKGEMKFETTRHDFGTFAQDTAIVTYDFVFTNTGKSPLIIHTATLSICQKGHRQIEVLFQKFLKHSRCLPQGLDKHTLWLLQIHL